MVTVVQFACRTSVRALGQLNNPFYLHHSQTVPRQLRGRRTMATVKDSIPHVVRTAQDQRQQGLYTATIGRIEQVNSGIRLFRLYLDTDQVGSSSSTYERYHANELEL